MANFDLDEIMDRVLNSVDIVDVVGSYVQIKRQGNTYFGLCPFHGEKTASFSVSQRKQMFYCFGCHKGGNAVTFIRDIENISFWEALEIVAKQGGVELPKREYTPEQQERKAARDKVQEICTEAARYYRQVLNSKEGENGYHYFRNRGLSDEIIAKFGLGYSTMRGGLCETLKKKGFSDQDMLKSGIVSFSEKDGFKDKFWNRVMFPIFDANGKVVALGGRVLGDAKPKYLNSDETDIFYKRKTIYALNYAKKSRRKGLILCEGYMDVISLHQAGFDNTIAALGTAFTEDHARILTKYVKDLVYIAFDTDEAGRDAKLRAIKLLDAVGIRSKVIDVSPHKDTDEFIKAEGTEAFEDRIRNAENSFIFELSCRALGVDRADPTEESEFCDYAFTEAFLRYGSDPMTLNVYVKSICDRFGIDGNLAKEKINKISREKLPRQKVEVSELPEETFSKKETRKRSTNSKQTLLLHYLSEFPNLYSQIKDFISPLDFDPPVLRRAAELLYGQLEAGTVNPQAIAREFTEPEDEQLVTGIFFETFTNGSEEEEKPEEISKGLTQLLKSIKEESIERSDNGLSFKEKMEAKKLIETISKTSFSV